MRNSVKPFRLILLLLAVAGLSVARQAPGPSAELAQFRAAEVSGQLTPGQWVEILSPVLAVVNREE